MIAEANDLTIDAMDVGSLSLTAGGDITQNANVSSSGPVTVVSDSGSIRMGSSSSTTAIGQEIRYAAPNGDILIGLLDAGKGSGGGVVRIQEGEFAVSPFGARNLFSSNGSNDVNIRAASAFVEVADQMGERGNPIVFSVEPGPITLFATEGFIDTSGGADPVSVRPEVIIVGGRISDELGRAIGAVGAATATGLKTVAYINWDVLSVDVSLFGTVEQGIRLPCSQREDIDPEECEREQQETEPVSQQTRSEPDQDLLVSTVHGWRWLPVFSEARRQSEPGLADGLQ